MNYLSKKFNKICNKFTIYSIYRITNLVNDKKYIGFSENVEQRLKKHKRDSKKSQTTLYRAIRKHGTENFIFEVIYQSKDGFYMLRIMEEHFIREYDTYGKGGYNMTYGGEGTLGYVCSEETKKKLSIINCGSKHPQFGIKRSEETKSKISNAHKGIKLSEDHIFKIKQSLNDDLSKVAKRRKRYRIYFDGGCIEVIWGLARFCKNNNYSYGCVCMVLSGRRKRHKDIIKVERVEAI